MTGAALPGRDLGPDYWWRNIREPVRFQQAVEAALERGAGIFIEIGPRALLANNVAEIIARSGRRGVSLHSFSESRGEGRHDALADPVIETLARAVVAGVRYDRQALFGAPPRGRQPLPGTSWRRRHLGFTPSAEAVDLYGTGRRHPLLGSRLAPGGGEWRNLIDATKLPWLADHVVDGKVVMPAAGFSEMLFALGREVMGDDAIALEDIDILQPFVLVGDGMRELAVVWHDASRSAEIRSRPRLAGEDWTTHARGRILPASGAPRSAPALTGPLDRVADEACIYGLARSSGMHYGPRFSRARHMLFRDDAVDVALEPGAEVAPYLSDLFGIDAAFHTLFQLMDQVEGEKRTYLPVRFGRFRLYRDRAGLVRAEMRQEHRNGPSLLASVTWYDEAGGIVATLDGGLFRATVLERSTPREASLHRRWTRLLRRDDRVGAIRKAWLDETRSAGEGDASEALLLTEAFAAALSHRALAETLGTGRIDRARIAQRVGKAALPLARTLVTGLAATGLAERDGGDILLAAESGLPDPARLLATFAAEAPGASAELTLGARALAHLPAVLAGADWPQSLPTIDEQFLVESLFVRPLLDKVGALVERLAEALAPEPVRILLLEPACAGLPRLLEPLRQKGRVAIAVAGADPDAVAALKARGGQGGEIAFLGDLGEGSARSEVFDLVLGLGWRDPFSGDAGFARRVSVALALDGTILIPTPPASLALDILRAGLGEAATADPSALRRSLIEAGFGETEALTSRAGTLVIGRAQKAASVAHSDGSPDLLSVLPNTGREATLRHALCGEGGASPRWLASGSALAATDAERLARAILLLRDWLGTEEPARRLLVLVETGDPVAEAILAFLRSASNEYPDRRVQGLWLDRELAPAVAAARIGQVLAEAGDERELWADAAGLLAPRAGFGRETANHRPRAGGARLQPPGKGLAARFTWRPDEPDAPDPGAVEVRVVATGLNFRDVMLAMGLLDDDVLDAGLAGAVLGFECSGIVTRIGAGVTTLRPGDAVMGFAASAFASHVSGPASSFIAVPDGIGTEAAAALPVAFLTAWYALHEVARLKAGESVLIHGAAGGVGLAALQIAKLKGATVIASVGAPDKAALVRFLGADHVTTSRSTGFADDVRRWCGGVDVVLNSLAGEAMQAGLGCLKPFGRFVELGKRDYVLNTAVGLRPFRRNLAYFGIDIDQLLASDGALVARLLSQLAEAFATGALSPLPYRLFPAEEAGDAFRLMQSAGHVGKILVAPPATFPAVAEPPQTFAAGAGTHLVIGGTGGFGFETALWLAEKGARRIVLASRRGELAPELDERAQVWRARSVSIEAVTLDVSDGAAVRRLVAEIEGDGGRLAGIMHCAASLDDGLIAGLDEGRLAAVLAPKVTGAGHLDDATDGLELDYFVLFSSATTLIGSPGQGAYVAANGYLEGLARRRRAEGRSALAVAWGAIADAGMLARDPATLKRLERLTGVGGMPVAEALTHLERLMTEPGPPVATIARLRPGQGEAALPIFATPAFAGLAETEARRATRESGDMASRLAALDEPAARALLVDVVLAEAAQIMRAAPSALDPQRSLADLGMDSLMGLELRIAIEKSCGVELPTLSIGAGTSIEELAGQVLDAVRRGEPGRDEDGAEMLALVARHMPEQARAAIAPAAQALGEQLKSRKSAL